MKILCIIQARMSSTRLHGKVMLPLNGVPIIKYMHDRVAFNCDKIDNIVIATTDQESDDAFCGYLHRAGISYYRGEQDNVLKRFHDAAHLHSANIIIRLTADCPFIDTYVINSMVELFLQGNYSYITNRTPATFPDGFDVEIFTVTALREAFKNANSQHEMEHVTPYFYEGRSDYFNYENNQNLSDIRLTLDTAEDYELISDIHEKLLSENDFRTERIIELYYALTKEKKTFEIRDAGAKIPAGVKLWNRASEIIPNGNMLLSKNADQHLPNRWPAYFKSAKGVKIKDLSGNTYIDCHLMGVGTNLLGYGHVEVDRAVIEIIEKGNMSTLNAPEEVWLAEELLRLDTWADQVRFTRTGGEASAVATRLGRAASGKDEVAVCGYHGWHDWYLSANLSSPTNLSKHLLPGLSTIGIPTALNDVTHGFLYNDFVGLKKLVTERDIGVIQMEVRRNEEPLDGFLNKVRSLCDQKGIVLIFDECSSGFRETSSGLYKKYNVVPDVVIYGKALGNGYAVNAIVGKREIMEQAKHSFISSTFWTERIGSAAALKCLEVMQREESWSICTEIGKRVQKNWKLISKKNNLPIKISGLPALSSFTFCNSNHLKYKTYITQEMLELGILASNVFYTSTAHTDNHLANYFDALNDIFYRLKVSEDTGSVDELLKVEVCHSGFGRMN